MSSNNSQNIIETSSSSESVDQTSGQIWVDDTPSPPTPPRSRQQPQVGRRRPQPRVEPNVSSSDPEDTPSQEPAGPLGVKGINAYREDMKRIQTFIGSNSSTPVEATQQEPNGSSGIKGINEYRENMKRIQTFIESNSSDSSDSSVRCPTKKHRKFITNQSSSTQSQFGPTEDMHWSDLLPSVYENPIPGTSSSQSQFGPTEDMHRSDLLPSMYMNPTPGTSSGQSQFGPSRSSNKVLKSSSTASSDNEIGPLQTQHIHGQPTVPTEQQFDPIVIETSSSSSESVNLTSGQIWVDEPPSPL